MNNRIRQEAFREKNLLGKKRDELESLKKQLSRKERILSKLRIELRTLSKIYTEIIEPKIKELDSLRKDSQKTRQDGRTKNSAQEHNPSGSFSRQPGNEADENTLQCDDFEIKVDPTDSFKELYRRVAKAVHPDLSTDEEERQWRQKLMAEANNAYTKKDYESLRAILRQWENCLDSRETRDISVELSLIVRKISWMEERLHAVETEIVKLKDSDLYRLLVKVEEAQYEGVDLLAEMAKKIDLDIESFRAGSEKTTPHEKENVSFSNHADRDELLICFPSDHPAGKLFRRKATSESFLDWRYHGEARGEVSIPAGFTLRLDVIEGRGRTLSFLNTIGPYDLQALFLHESSDEELFHLRRLAGLRELYLSGNNVTDAGVQELRKLKSLHRLYLYDTAITDMGAEALHNLSGLRCITFCGSGITDHVMRKIKSFLPGCRIILLNRPSVKAEQK